MNTDNQRQRIRSRRKLRSAFTLIELLLVISIIAVLGTLAVGVIESSQEDARTSATRARVQMIQKLMEVELEDYEVRRSPLPFGNIQRIANRIVMEGQWDSAVANRRLHIKNLKRMITLDLIRAAMPDFRNGTSGVAIGQFPTPRFITYLQTLGVGDPTTDTEIIAAYQGYDRVSSVLRWSGWTGGTDSSDASANSSEVLYRILAELDVDGTNGIDLLGNSAIGDTDADGVLEVVDAWGGPLRFEFHQRVICPAEQNVAIPPTPAPALRSGVWETVDPSLFPGSPELTDFDVVLPNLPSEIQFYVTSDKLLEVDGALNTNQFQSSANIPQLQYQ